MKTYEVTVVSDNWIKTHTAVTDIELHEGVLILRTKIPAAPYFEIGYNVAKLVSWDTKEQTFTVGN